MERHLGVRAELHYPVYDGTHPLRYRLGIWQCLACGFAVYILFSSRD